MLISIIIEMSILLRFTNRNMSKKEVIWREILFQKRQNNKIKFTQKELAEKFDFSLSTVFNAVRVLRDSHIIKVTGRFFVLLDYKKLLYLWASERNLEKEIYYKCFVPKDIRELEGIMPPKAIPALYSGFKFYYNQAPADYDHLYFYADKELLFEILQRFSPDKNKKSYPNLFVIKPDEWFKGYPQPLPEQLFVDFWNASEWYAKDFIKILEEKL